MSTCCRLYHKSTIFVQHKTIPASPLQLSALLGQEAQQIISANARQCTGTGTRQLMTSHFVTTFKVNSEARLRGIVFEQELLSVQCIVILVLLQVASG